MPTSPDASASILDDVHAVIAERGGTYGHPYDNHGRTAELWSTYLDMKITAEDVCWMMMLVKVSRQIHSPHRDNRMDVVGYAANIDMIQDERERRLLGMRGMDTMDDLNDL